MGLPQSVICIAVKRASEARMRIIPSVRLGWRTRLYDLARVKAALLKLEVPAVG
jgi:hypothetical protein